MANKTSRTNPIDVLIIGGGPAGLTCASQLARLLHTSIVFSSNKFRNEKSAHMHGVLTWVCLISLSIVHFAFPPAPSLSPLPLAILEQEADCAIQEHRNPADFRVAARKDILAHYNTVSFENVTIEKVEKTQREDRSSLFKATDTNGDVWWGRKVALCMGVQDLMPDIEGYEECWASGM